MFYLFILPHRVTSIMVYYSLSMGTSNLEGNMYVNVAVAGLLELPVNFIIEMFLQKVNTSSV